LEGVRLKVHTVKMVSPEREGAWGCGSSEVVVTGILHNKSNIVRPRCWCGVSL
jgi:hypothetical protein